LVLIEQRVRLLLDMTRTSIYVLLLTIKKRRGGLIIVYVI